MTNDETLQVAKRIYSDIIDLMNEKYLAEEYAMAITLAAANVIASVMQKHCQKAIWKEATVQIGKTIYDYVKGADQMAQEKTKLRIVK